MPDKIVLSFELRVAMGTMIPLFIMGAPNVSSQVVFLRESLMADSTFMPHTAFSSGFAQHIFSHYNIELFKYFAEYI